MKTKPIILLLLCIVSLLAGVSLIAGCKSQSASNRLIGNWALSDDLDEYHGLYYYTLTEDRKIKFTHYPENYPDEKKTIEDFGSWSVSNDILKWTTSSGERSLSFKKGDDNIYSTTNYVSLRTTKLISVKLINGVPNIDY